MAVKDWLDIRNPFNRIIFSSVPVLSATGVALAQELTKSADSTAANGASILGVAAVAIAPLAGIAGNTFAEAISNKFFSRYKREDILKNGDLEKAVGDAICATILTISKENHLEANADVLKKLSKVPAETWERLAAELEKEKDSHHNLSIEEIERLLPQNMPDIFAIPAKKFNEAAGLNARVWEKILRKLCNLQGISASNEDHPKFTDTITLAALTLEKDFRNILKHTIIGNKDGKAYANLQLKIIGETLYLARENFETNRQMLGKTNEILDKLDALEKRNDQLVALNASLEQTGVRLDDTFWQKAFDLSTNIFDNTEELLARSGRIEELLGKMFEMLETLTSQQQQQQQQPAAAVSNKLPVKSFPKLTGFFTGRTAALQKIRDTLQKHRNASLFGIHGLGKTTISTKYAYEFTEDYSRVFFIKATNDAFVSEMAECAADLGYEFDDKVETEQRAQKFRGWLSQNRGWLVILDNVEDIDRIKKYHLPNENGHLLYTSNFSWVKNFGQKVDFEVMETDEAELFLYRRAEQDSAKHYEDIPAAEIPVIREIVSELGFLPLAVNIAGSYIAENQKTFADYLKLYRDYGDEILTIEDESDSYQYHSVYRVFSLAFESISKSRDESEKSVLVSEAAIHCLMIASFLDSTDIPEEIFKKCLAAKGEKFKKLVENDLRWDAVVREFVSYSLFSKDAARKTFSTHQLLQKVIFTKLGDKENELAEQIAQVLDKLFPEYEYENKPICDRYISHLQAFLSYVGRDDSTFSALFRLPNQNVSSLLQKAGEYYYSVGDLVTGSKFFRISYKFNDAFFGQNDKKTLESYHSVAMIYYDQNKYTQATKLIERIVRTQEKNLGLANKDFIDSCNSLLTVYYEADKKDLASRLYQRLYGLREVILRKDDTELIFAYLKAISQNYHQNRNTDAESVCKRAVAKIERLLGLGNVKVSESYALLNYVYFSDNDLEKCEKICRRIMENFEKFNLTKRNLFLEQQRELAYIHMRRGDYDEARNLLETSIRELDETLPENHYYTLTFKNSLVWTYFNEQKFEEAANVRREIIKGYIKILGENNQTTLLHCVDLALIYMNQNKLREARDLCRKTLDKFEKNFGFYHRNTNWARQTLEKIQNKIQENLRNK